MEATMKSYLRKIALILGFVTAIIGIEAMITAWMFVNLRVSETAAAMSDFLWSVRKTVRFDLWPHTLGGGLPAIVVSVIVGIKLGETKLQKSVFVIIGILLSLAVYALALFITFMYVAASWLGG
jgi:flagellar basal body-associated protein FliL